MQTLDRLLLNRHVQRLRSATGILSAVVFLLGLVTGADLLILIGVILLAATVVLLAWTKIRKHEGDDLLTLLRPAANQLAWNLKHFPNWWPAVEEENFGGKLPDGYGPVTHPKAMETLLFMFGQFFSAAWTYQRFCATHLHHAKVKTLVDEVYDVLGMPGDPVDLATDARIGSDQLHLIGERSTRGEGSAKDRPVQRSDFRPKMEYHAEAFEPLEAFLLEAGPDTAARARLKAAEQAVKRVEEWLKENRYGR
ncbi:MAG TPA: hypothetical protein VFN92_04220 [Solirubrobacterales bacterium]|nr:hypothetical protein [Solirubrobacterales bacterium]